MHVFLKLKTNFVVSIVVENGRYVWENLLHWWIEWMLLGVKKLIPCVFRQMRSSMVFYAACGF